MATIYIKTDKNGTKYYSDNTCKRCGGAGGSNAWAYTGVTCYRCNGSGIDPKPVIIKEYTPEYEEILKAKRIKRAKAEAERINADLYERTGIAEDGTTWIILGNTYAVKDELKEAGAKYSVPMGWVSPVDLEGFETVKFDVKPYMRTSELGTIYFEGAKNAVDKIREDAKPKPVIKSKHQGKEGDKLSIDVTLKRIGGYFRQSFGRSLEEEFVNVFNFEDVDGNIYVWHTTSSPRVNGTNEVPDTDKAYSIKGTVKRHTEYKDVPQTELTRVKIFKNL